MKSWLTHPLMKDLNLDNPATTYLRQRIIQKKSFLRLVHEEWYEFLVNSIPEGSGTVVEIGSGAGFFKKMFSLFIQYLNQR